MQDLPETENPEDEVDWNDPKLSSRAVRGYLEPSMMRRWLKLFPGKSRSPILSLVGQQRQAGGPAYFAYPTHDLIDTEHGVILNVEATLANRYAVNGVLPPRKNRG